MENGRGGEDGDWKLGEEEKVGNGNWERRRRQGMETGGGGEGRTGNWEMRRRQEWKLGEEEKAVNGNWERR
jgi:hypothetical protein